MTAATAPREVVRKRDLAYLSVLDALEEADAFSPL